jgi:hypothetical protein
MIYQTAGQSVTFIRIGKPPEPVLIQTTGWDVWLEWIPAPVTAGG